MQVLNGLSALGQLPPRAAMTIGNFDGIHLGHRRILRTARDLADRREGSALAVVTFEPHPMTVLRPHLAPPRLSPLSIKQQHLADAGVDYLAILPPQPQVLGLSAERFWEILRDEIRIAHLIEGPTFRFGKGAAGTIPRLQQWSAGSPVALHVIGAVEIGLVDMQLVRVSSSIIRILVSFGRVRDAAICLGQPYALTGTVQRGFARGRQIGFPTANLFCEDQLVPADGVYVGRCTIAGQTYPAGVSIGTNPTFGENPRQVEAHLIGFNGDLYDQTISVELIDWLRDQQKYFGIEPLKKQIERDLLETKLRSNRDPSRPIAV